MEEDKRKFGGLMANAPFGPRTEGEKIIALLTRIADALDRLAGPPQPFTGDPETREKCIARMGNALDGTLTDDAITRAVVDSFRRRSDESKALRDLVNAR